MPTKPDVAPEAVPSESENLHALVSAVREKLETDPREGEDVRAVLDML